MFTVINMLTFFFILLIIYKIILANSNIIEGITTQSNEQSEYKSSDTNDPNNALILSQQNAGNISYLKQQVDTVLNINEQLKDLSGNVTTLQEQVNGLIQANQQYTANAVGNTPPNISGSTE